MCYSTDPMVFVKRYVFLSFAKNICKNIDKNINQRGKYSQKLLDHAKESVTDIL